MYIDRDIAKLLKRYATQYPVVTITGPRQSGKTTLCKHTFPDKKYVSLEDLDNREYANSDPRGFLSEYSNGVIIDEIQRVPDLLSYIQGIVDNNNIKGEFILTGSSQLELTKSVSQSLAGRTILLKLLPFSYTEIYDKTQLKPSSLDKILYNGFYPRICVDKLDAFEALSSYISTYIERDVRQFYEIKDLTLFQRFLHLCASRVGQLLNYSNIASDCGVSVPTIQNWISVLEQSFIIYRLPPFFANIKKRLVKTPKIYFYDTGLCAFLNGVKNVEHIQSLPTRGNLFENFIITEFIKMDYHNNFKNDFYFYRDKTGIEVDLIINNGQKNIPLEIKAGQTFANDFIKNIDYYRKITGTETKGTIIYTGKTQKRTDHNIYNYYDSFKTFIATGY
jgi:uncharacterized protein